MIAVMIRSIMATAVIAASIPLGILGQSPAAAEGTPDISVTMDGPEDVLIGDTASFRITACNRTGTDGYNLSHRVVLPAGITYAGAKPAASMVLPDEPAAGSTTVIWQNTSDLLSGACASISLTVDSDRDDDPTTNPVGSQFALQAGSFINEDPFWIPDFDEHGEPVSTPSADGNESYTGWGESSPLATRIVAFTVDKDPGNNGEHELTRGVHGDDPKWTTLTITNNPKLATNGFEVIDVLPPGLEFLGCTDYLTADNTTAAPTNTTGVDPTEEYPGAGPLAGASHADCLPPSSIETLTAPTILADGSTAPVGSTRVTWSATPGSLGAGADLAAGEELVISYLAGIPLRQNTDTWPDDRPTAESLGQGRNLDNNNGPLTSETGTEQGITNRVAAIGTYQGPTEGIDARHTVTTEATVTAEDLLIRKRSNGHVVQGARIDHTLVIETGEYRDITDLIVTDTLPNGMCPLGRLVDGTPADPTCGSSPSNPDPTIDLDDGSGVHDMRYDSAVENPDGTWTLVLSSANTTELRAIDHDRAYTIALSSLVRSHYRANSTDTTPVLTGDSMTNNVEVVGESNHRSDNGVDVIVDDGTPDGTVVRDISHATIEGKYVSIDKRVSEKAGPLANGSSLTAAGPDNIGDVCAAGPGGGITWADGSSGPEQGFEPGDFVCFDLRAEFPINLDSAGVRIDDFMPSGYAYVGGSERRIIDWGDGDDDTLPDLVATPIVRKNVVMGISFGTDPDATTLDGTVPNGGEKFHWTIAARVGPPDMGVAGDITANLMKLTTRNTVGEVFQLRDEAAVEWTEPQVELVKGVERVTRGTVTTAGPFGPDDDGHPVQAGDVVTYRVDLFNGGNVDATDTEVWDRLPDGITCADVSGVSDGGTCSDGASGTHVKWPATGIGVAQGTSVTTPAKTLTYEVTIPDTVAPDVSLENTAGVRSYRSETNASDSPYVYYPRNNIDPTVIAGGAVLPNTDPATDVSEVHTTEPRLVKIQGSGVTEAGNGSNSPLSTAADQATIGETITYSVTLTIPEGTTVHGGVLTDKLPSGLLYAGNLTLDATASDLSLVNSLKASTVSTPAVGSNGTVTITLPSGYKNDTASDDDTLTVTFDVVVANNDPATGNKRGKKKDNTARFAWAETAGGSADKVLDSNEVRTTIVEPSVAVAKSDDALGHEAVPGATVGFTLDITNPTTGGNVSTAHELVVVDTVPIGLTPTNGGVTVVDGGTVAPDGGVWDDSTRTITWTRVATPSLQTLVPGGTVQLTYEVTVDDPAQGGSVLTNTVEVTSTSMAGSPARERTYSTDASATLNAPSPALTKTVDPTTATVGDPLTYTLTVSVPANTRLHDAVVLDTLPAGVAFDAYGPITRLGTSSSGCPGADTLSAITPASPGAAGTTSLGVFIGDITAPADGPCDYRIMVDAHVEPDLGDGAGPGGSDTPVIDGTELTNTARVVWNDTDDPAMDGPTTVPDRTDFDRTTSPVDATTTITEPSIEINKDSSATGCHVDAPGTYPNDESCSTNTGSSYTFTLRVHNNGSAAAHDIDVTDTPNGLITNVDTSSPPAGVTVTDPWSTADPTMGWRIAGPIAPGATVVITYTADLVASSKLTNDAQVTNTVDVPQYWAASTSDRSTNDPGGTNNRYRSYGNDPGGPGGDVDGDTVTMAVRFPRVTVVKSAVSDPGDARVGQAFTWKIVATNATGTMIDNAFDMVLRDDLPSGWSYVNGSGRVTTPYDTDKAIEPTCAPTCAVGASLQWTGAVSGPTQPVAPGQSVTLTFDATPTSVLWTVGTTGTHDHVNTAGATAADRTGARSNESGSYVGTDSTANARIRRADLSITKTASGGPHYVGSTADFTITVTNSGPDDATGVAVTDALPTGLTHHSVVSATRGTFDTSSGIWSVGGLADGASATLVVRATITAKGVLTNTAEVTAADQWDPDSTPGNRNTKPGEDDTASAKITAIPSSIGDRVWFDIDADGVQGPDEPGLVGVRVELSGPGPDGIFGNSDDVVLASTTTGSNGQYGFEDLPIGRYRVRVDTSTLPGGLTQTYDDDAGGTGTLDDTSGTITLADDTGYLGADFGYTGTGSIGDLVWTDLDADGAQGVGETELSGADITVTWFGFDGVPGTADDVAYTTTTAVDGSYTIGNLPPGTYRVSVDPATIPSGMVSVSNPPDGANGSADVLLTAGQNRTDVDFGFRPEADLAVTKTHDGKVFNVGAKGTFHITVTNHGPAVADPVTISDELPKGLTPTIATGAGVTCTIVGQMVTCTADDPLAVGGSLTATVTVAVDRAAVPGVSNTANATSPIHDPDTTNNSSTDRVPVPFADLELVKTLVGELRADEEATYDLLVTNHGPTSAPLDTVITDQLPDGLEFVSATARGWDCSRVGGTVTCRATAEIEVNTSSTVRLVTRVAANASGPIINTATVESPISTDGGRVDPNTDNNSGSASAQVLPAHVELWGTGDRGGSTGASAQEPPRRMAYTGSNAVRGLLIGVILLGLGVFILGVPRPRGRRLTTRGR